MLVGPTNHQQLHQPSVFGLSMTGNAPVVACRSQLPPSTTNPTTSPSLPTIQSPYYHSSSSNPQSQQIQIDLPNMLQAPVDRPIIQEYFRAQSSILESQSNNNKHHSNYEHVATPVHNDTNKGNEIPMLFDTTKDKPPQTDFSSTYFNDMKKNPSR